MNRVRGILRSCVCGRKASGVDACFTSRVACVKGETCAWRAALMHPLDEPDDLQRMGAPAQTETPAAESTDALFTP